MAPRHDETLGRFLDRAFGKKAFTSMFPHVFGPGNESRHFALVEQDSLVGFCALHPFHWLIDHRLVRAHCLGSVATESCLRGRGLGSRVVAMAENFARADKADFLFLFTTDQGAFYERLGYRPAGNDLLAPLQLQQLPSARDCASPEARSWSIRPPCSLPLEQRSRIWRFLMTHSTESDLGFLEFEQLLHTSDMELIEVATESETRAIAFLGKGADFQNIVHSTAFRSEADLLWLLDNLLRVRGPLLLLLPPGNPELANHFPEILHNDTLWFKSLNERDFPTERLESLFLERVLYPRTIQSA